MNYIICRMIKDKLPEQWYGVITKICADLSAYSVEGDKAFKMYKSPEECYKMFKSEYKDFAYRIYIEGNNVVITDVL